MGEKTGKVKLYDAKRGFGFVTADKRDYFFSWRDIVAKHQHCYGGQIVTFIPQQSIRGLRAVQVQALQREDEKVYCDSFKSIDVDRLFTCIN